MPTSSSPAHDFGQLVTQVWQHRLSFLQLVEHAEQLQASGNSPLAAVLYQTWLARGNAASAHFAAFNLGVLLFAGQDLAGAGKAYLQALEYKTDFHEARLNLALVLEHQADTNSACDQLRWIADHADATDPQQRPLLISALNNLGRMLERCKEYGPALGALDRSLALDPQQRDVLHHWVFIRQKQCLWPIYDHSQGFDPALMREATSALALLSLSDDPAAQLAAARQYAERKIPADLPALAAGQSYAHDKIRIAYCSSDFCLHPVSMLTVELFELHDRERFEVYGFCWSPEDGSALRQRVIQAFDHFIRLDTLDDDDAAQLIRKHEIDILIDLHGQTRGARPQMIARRPAPIQITYLGLPATTGLPAIDYVIADRFLIPEEYAHFYSEKPLYLPDVYQVSDRRRPCAEAPSRQECGLPDDAFVFCSLNNNHKYTPEVFACWMNILRRVPHSVLWLLADNRWAEENLRKEAEKHGIDSGRLLFSKRVSPEQYLARYTAADLFLDTFPFNAGTTANDALWMGLPILTLSGKSFAARMAGALLSAANLPELITFKLEDYEEQAVALAQDRTKLAAIKEKLVAARQESPLFDSKAFAQHLENSFIRLLQEKNQHKNESMRKITDKDCLESQDAPTTGIEKFLPEHIVDIVKKSEQFQQAGDKESAIKTYQDWLESSSSDSDWIAHFNLGILLKERNDIALAEQSFQSALLQKPDFTQARAALAQLAHHKTNLQKPSRNIDYYPKILLIRSAAIGDVILTLPIIRKIHDDHDGKCHIDVATAFPDVFNNNPWVRQTLTPSSAIEQSSNYDKVINLNLGYERYPSLHIIDAYEKITFGRHRHIENRRPMLFPLADDVAHVEKLLQPLAGRRLMVIHMRQGAWPSRNIPHHTWRTIIDQVLMKTDLTIVQIGANTDFILNDLDHDRIIDFSGKLNLQQLQALMERSHLFFGIDSGTMHVASCTDIPIVCLFTSAHHDYRKPFRNLDKNIFIPVSPDIACYGCQARFTPPITGVICDQGDPMSPPCRDQFDVEKIIDAILAACAHPTP